MIKNLLENIKKEILAIPDIQSCFIYPDAREEIYAPAVFLEVANYSHATDAGTGELALKIDIECRVVVDSLIEDAEIVCQSLALKIADAAHLNDFGCKNVQLSEITGISRDVFKPEFDAYICWLVEWEHEIHVETNVWLENGAPPHILHIDKAVCDE